VDAVISSLATREEKSKMPVSDFSGRRNGKTTYKKKG